MNRSRQLNRIRPTAPKPATAPVHGQPPVCPVRPAFGSCSYYTNRDGERRCYYCANPDPRQDRK